MDVLQWDVCHLPLKSHSVDVVVTDLVSALSVILILTLFHSHHTAIWKKVNVIMFCCDPNTIIFSIYRCGSWQANWILYPRVLKELGRVCRPSSARAILLTHDNKALSKVSIFIVHSLKRLTSFVGFTEEFVVEESEDTLD